MKASIIMKAAKMKIIMKWKIIMSVMKSEIIINNENVENVNNEI